MIINDPVYGFISIPRGIIVQLIEHPYFQRLRRIKQLGLTYLIYPGAVHSRFQHALGALSLMIKALEVLRSKGHKITDEEFEAACIAILLHDLGHGPFSHTLESIIIRGVNHEEISITLMEQLNEAFDGALELALQIFRGKYYKKFLTQLVSGQLDVDRLDYLTRDSFYTGVAEGKVGYDRIVKMLDVRDNQIVIQEKGIYPVENFLLSRRLMYWQVYLHKTVIAAEQTLIQVLKRARHLCDRGTKLSMSRPLEFFINNSWNIHAFQDEEVVTKFTQLDDYDIWMSLKEWQGSDDRILSFLSNSLINRKLLKVKMRDRAFSETLIDSVKYEVKNAYHFKDEELKYVVFYDIALNKAYSPEKPKINILYKNESTKDIAIAADQFNISALSKPVKKYYICFPEITDFKLI